MRKAIRPPVTAEWVDMVVADRSEKADRIEESKGPEAASRYREKTGRMVQKMVKRGVV